MYANDRSLAEDECTDQSQREYSGCGMSKPCDGDNGGGKYDGRKYDSWCLTEDGCENGAGADWDYCSTARCTDDPEWTDGYYHCADLCAPPLNRISYFASVHSLVAFRLLARIQLVRMV